MYLTRKYSLTTLVVIACLAAFCWSKTDTDSLSAEIKAEESGGTTFAEIASKILGYLIILLCPIVRLIQIMKCHNMGSTAGISFNSMFLDYCTGLFTFGYSYHYNYPFSTYGEFTPLFLGCTVICAQIYWFDGAWKFPNETGTGRVSTLTFQIACAAMGLLLAGYLADVFPSVIVDFAMSSSTILFIISKADQIRTIIKDKSTGANAMIPYVLVTLGNVTRIGTSIVETGD